MRTCQHLLGAFAALAILLSPVVTATPPQMPPERYAIDIVRAPAAGEWGELRATFWREDGAAAVDDLALELPNWVTTPEALTWHASAPAGEKASRTWMVRPTHEGLWSARIGWGENAIAWASASAGGGYDELPRVLSIERDVSVLPDGRVRILLEAQPTGAWVQGQLVAEAWSVGTPYDGTKVRSEGALEDGARVELLLTPDAGGKVAFQESFEPVLRFDGPAKGTPYRVQSESHSRTYVIEDGAARELEVTNMHLEAEADGSPAQAQTSPRARLISASFALTLLAALTAGLASRTRRSG